MKRVKQKDKNPINQKG